MALEPALNFLVASGVEQALLDAYAATVVTAELREALCVIDVRYRAVGIVDGLLPYRLPWTCLDASAACPAEISDPLVLVHIDVWQILYACVDR